MPRVLVVYGTETGSAKNAINKIASSLASKNGEVKIVDTLCGNSVPALESLPEKYDMLLVSTSSFGEGDPPGNYGRFLAKLLKGAQNGSMPLKGMQHAVLGLGSSAYETFQNCPRLSDKFLGECGSLRVAKRVELDDCGSEPDDRKEKLATFEADVLKALTSPPKASAKPVCDWTEPAKEIMEKEESDLLMFADSDSSGGGMIIGGVVLAAALAAGYAYQTGMFE